MLIFENPNHFMYSRLIDLLCSFLLTQVVPSFTHESPRGSRTLIDLALLADVLNLLSCLTVPPCHYQTILVCLLFSSAIQAEDQLQLHSDVCGCIIMLTSHKHRILLGKLTGTVYFQMTWITRQNYGQRSFLI